VVFKYKVVVAAKLIMSVIYLNSILWGFFTWDACKIIYILLLFNYRKVQSLSEVDEQYAMLFIIYSVNIYQEDTALNGIPLFKYGKMHGNLALVNICPFVQLDLLLTVHPLLVNLMG
jgi:hypothetical protein